MTLAEITLVRADSAYLIESVEERSVKKYIPTLTDAWKRMEYRSCFCAVFPSREYGKNTKYRKMTAEKRGECMLPAASGIETGIVEIPLGEKARKGDIRCSAQVVHGLGKGNVFVEVGYEYLEENEECGKSTRATIFGNPELFQPQRTQACAETAVKVLNDRGTFIVAVRLLRDVKQLVLTYRWAAVRYDSERLQEETERDFNRSISAATPTVALAAKESYLFQVNYHGMKPCHLSYELTEPGSGEVTAEGIYTAPSKEGIYEIRIYCTDDPLICTYAYAIVKKTKTDEKESQ